MAVPNTFSSATGNIPLSQLDANFATPLTIGNTAAQLGNVVTTLNNITLANATVTSLFTPLAVTAGGTGSNATTYCSLTSNVTGTLPVANGGTGSTSTTFCSLTTNVTGTLPVANGGTGATSLASNNVLLGNGTSAVQVVAPGTSGNVLTSNGTTWTSTAGASGGLTLVATLSPSGVNSISALGLSQYESFLIVTDTITVATADQLQFALSSNNGTSYGGWSTFTASSTSVSGMVQIYRCKTASVSKPYLTNYGVNNSVYAVYTSTTGIINAITFRSPFGYNFTGTIYIYGQG